MILVDTSIWIDHLPQVDAHLARFLNDRMVLSHPFVIGELACGNLRNRLTVLNLLQRLPHAPEADGDEVLRFIDRHHLMGRGLGYVDIHLLVATRLARNARLWTRDRRLGDVADALSLRFVS